MTTLKLSILDITHPTFDGDAILYLYLDNELKDALTLTKEYKKAPTSTLEIYPDSVIQITSKDLNHGLFLGSCSFLSSLLIDNPSGVILPLNSESLITNLENFSIPTLTLCLVTNAKQIKSPKNRENLRDSDIYKAIQSEIDLEKWKNTGLKQIREEMNSSELARVSVMQKICKTVENYEQDIAELKEKIAHKALMGNYSGDTLKKMQNVLKDNRELWAAKETDYQSRISKLQEESAKRKQEISNLKQENSKTKEEISELNKNKGENLIIHSELEEKQCYLEFALKNIKLELELNKSNLCEAVEQIVSFQNNNTKLRGYIEALEEKSERVVKDENFDILSLVHTHLDALSIHANVVQVTKNIFKIDNDSLYLFLANCELMTQQGPHTLSFVEWLQRNKWFVDGEDQCNNEKPKRLDTVPEEEVEDEIPVSPVIVRKKAVKKSPVKNLKEFSPILKKKSNK